MHCVLNLYFSYLILVRLKCGGRENARVVGWGRVGMVISWGLVGVWWAFTFIPHQGAKENLAIDS